ncbi:4-hydroxy-tetrahydrodipicolinate synthase [Candidatus Peregrinibacteria bacterium]|nr:4-hydroxy-tetrahydrodipicolinate synthase [Candidatus Peregrinibacteria bacterium]
MNKRKYAGTWTALVTPFKSDGALDEAALRKLVRRQVEMGVSGVTPVGTTGESPTTTAEEDVRIFEIVRAELDKANAELGRSAMMMAGTGSNCTADAVKYTKAAKEAGADACLVVSPYYNKPTPAGLKLHFHAIADVGLPVVVYNIKGRTGINIATDTLVEIARHPSVVAVKEASGDLAQMKEVIARREAGDFTEDFAILCGDDGMTLDLIRAGGDGVISVASNIVPDKVAEMVDYALGGNFSEAEKIGERLSDLFEKIFIETNPIPVKYCVSIMGLCELVYRLPMCEPSAETKRVLDEMLKNYDLIPGY